MRYMRYILSLHMALRDAEPAVRLAPSNPNSGLHEIVKRNYAKKVGGIDGIFKGIENIRIFPQITPFEEEATRKALRASKVWQSFLQSNWVDGEDVWINQMREWKKNGF